MDAEDFTIRSGCAHPTTPEMRCCCGRTDCAFLKHNCSALDELESEVRTAARLGQALLVRHEAYMQDAERDRLDMSTKIERLETDKRELEAENAKTIEENRGLLNQLEGLNDTLSESDAHIKALEATLQSTHQELRRLESLASRTHDLEVQLVVLEQEQEALQQTVVRTQADERTAIQRWKKAERRLCDIQTQLERIEQEAQEEKERHVEVLGRMERQRAVERELDTAAGRLKSAAAATTGKGKNGSNVVSHFVKDILQDNANLQLGIVELREMLMNSNDEVEALREQLMLHQPVAEPHEYTSEQSTLMAELGPKEDPEPKVISQELHIHHHYHTPKKEDIRRPKKKRTSINSSLFTPPRHVQAPTTPRGTETSRTILSQTSVTIPSPATPTNRWSMQSGQLSDFAPSSVPSSPQSMYRNGALFDRGFDVDSSRPTSPGSSVDPMSPNMLPSAHRKRGSEVSTRSFLAPTSFQPHNIIHEEENADVEEIGDLQETRNISSSSDEAMPFSTNLPLSPHEPVIDATEEPWTTTSFTSTLRRSTSHESILSISGIDIHTLKSRPSQLTIRAGRLRPSFPGPSTTTSLSIDTLTAPTLVTARPTLSKMGHDSTMYLRSSIAGVQGNGLKGVDRRSISSSGSQGSGGDETAGGNGMGKKVGGWVFSRWGVSPAKSTTYLRVPQTQPQLTHPRTRAQQQRAVSVSMAQEVDPLRAFMGRPPGINQKGPVPGFMGNKAWKKAESKVRAETVDLDALREGLNDIGE